MWRCVRISKAIALIAFLLPWLTVSCSGRPIVKASGWDLMTGRLAMTDPLSDRIDVHAGATDWWLVLAVVLIVVGLVIAFRRTPAPRTVLATSLGAVALVVQGTHGIDAPAVARLASREDARFDAAMAALIRIDWQYGYWLTLGALALAALCAALLLGGRSMALVSGEPPGGR
ncbi:hypothetical protein [uncultured Sphingomonas sp.]|uniref:hypothetical protein n=1 Tax=uncultured Sphingomonas sp. TaxID=158754 RepID=UPI0035CB73EF